VPNLKQQFSQTSDVGSIPIARSIKPEVQTGDIGHPCVGSLTMDQLALPC